MTRENQGLQIALIVFAVLTIVLGVSTFVFFHQYDEARRDREHALREARQCRAAARGLQEETGQVRQLIGGSPTEKLSSIQEQFARDAQTHAASYPEENRNYRNIVRYLANTLRQVSGELAAVKAENLAWKTRYETREAGRDPRIRQFQEAAARAYDELLTLQRTSREADRQSNQQKEGLARRLADTRKGANRTEAGFEARLDELNREYVELMGELHKLKNRYDAERNPLVSPDGRVRQVNQRNRTVRIDRGWADALRRLIIFNVHSTDPARPPGDAGKGSIEVTRILDDHLAEARILRDRISDPIVPGDAIHTPAWSPDRPVRFGLAGFMDVDGDGQSDLRTVRNLITLGGGLIDAAMDERGNVEGELSVQTRYLVVGQAPDERADPAVRAAFTKMLRRAETLGIEQIRLPRLLEQMGWREPRTPPPGAVSRLWRGGHRPVVWPDR